MHKKLMPRHIVITIFYRITLMPDILPYEAILMVPYHVLRLPVFQKASF